MTARAKIVAEARTWMGTPFLHQGRLKGVGVDCIGVVIGVAKALGISEFDITSYQRAPNPQMMQALLRQHLDEIAFSSVLLGDILWFRIVKEPQHVGIVTDISPLAMVHSYSRAGVDRCIEQPVPEVWQRRVAGCFRYRGIE